MAAEASVLDLPTAERLLAQVGVELRPVAVTRLTGGNTSAVFEVSGADGRAVVVKLYSDLIHWKMAKELFVYELLRPVRGRVPVATVLGADDSKTLVSQNVLALTKLEGVLVSEASDRLDERELASLNGQLGAILRTLHEVGFDAFGYVGTDGVVEPHRTNVDYMRFQFTKKLREFEELGGDASLRRTLERHVAEREQLLAGCQRAVLCHDDCHYGNVLVVRSADGWRVSGVLDLENAVAGDPLLDLAKAHCYSHPGSEALLAALADGYGDLRSDWREAIELYTVYHWLELWDWLALVGRRDSLPAIAEELRALIEA